MLVERFVADQHHLDGSVAQRDQRLVGWGFVPTTDRGRVGEPGDDRVGILVLASQDFGTFAAEDDLSAPLGEGGGDLASLFVPFLLVFDFDVGDHVGRVVVDVSSPTKV